MWHCWLEHINLCCGCEFFCTGRSYHCGVKWQTKVLSQARIADNVIMPLFLLQCQWNFTPFLWLTSIIKIRRDRKRVTNPPHTRETRSNSAEYIQYKPLTKQLGKTDALLDVKFIGLLHMAWPWAKLPLPQSCQANRPSNFAQIREIIKPLCRQAVTVHWLSVFSSLEGGFIH